MTREQDLAFTPAYELNRLIRAKEVSPVELTQLSLERIERLNPTLNAFLTVTADEALAAAKEAEAAVQRGDDVGPLHGIPTSIKDLEPTEGVRTTRGSLFFKDHVPDYDQLGVRRMKEAGMIILGKTNTPEFGMSGTTENKLGDDCRNPWNAERVSGGSSGGTGASIASGMNAVAQGSDGGGSIRIPSAFCGIYGIKATQGRVPRLHVGMGSWHPVNFSCMGPMSRTVRDSALLLQVMSGPHPDAEHGTIQDEPADYAAALDDGVQGLRIGWSADFGGSAAVDPEAREAAERAAQVFGELGADVEDAPFDIDLEAMSAWADNLGAMTYVTYGELYESDPDKLMPNVRRAIAHSKTITAQDYGQALCELEKMRAYVAGFFSKYDLLLTPTLAVPAFPCGEYPEVIGGREVSVFGYSPFTALFNRTGNPAASAPCGFSSDGLPLGLHIIGRRKDEVTVLRASAAFEQARPWADKIPEVS